MGIEIKGHSGCGLDLILGASGQIIKKSSKNEDYNARLRTQAYNQSYAHSLLSKGIVDGIKVPKVFTIQEDNFTMPYVNGMNFIEFFERGSIHEVKGLIDKLINFIEYELTMAPILPVATDVFKDKLQSIKSNIDKNSVIVETGNVDLFKTYIDKAIAMVDSFKQINIPVKNDDGFIHGDLTFSNVIIQGSDCYLIDFLDSFVETPLQDIVKLRQDTFFNWSTLMYSKNYDVIRVHDVLKYYDKKIDEHFSKYDWYNKYYTMMQLINILRIVPYVKEQGVMYNLIKYLSVLV